MEAAVNWKALDEEYRTRKGKGKGSPLPRQYRARTPPPTARMIAMGRVQKPAHRDEDCDWRGSKNRVNSSTAVRAEKGDAKGAGKDGEAKGGRTWQARKPGGEAKEAIMDEQELLPDSRETEPHTDTPELDEDSDSDNAVPSFLFDSSP